MQARLELRAGEDRGRIYRVMPAGALRRGIPNLAILTGKPLVEAMDSPNGWQRDMVQRLILERREPEAAAHLKPLLALTRAPQVRVQALATLGLLDGLDRDALLRALVDPHPWVRVEALRQSEPRTAMGVELFSAVAALTRDGSAAVRMQAAYSLGAWPADQAESVLGELVSRDDVYECVWTVGMASVT